MTHALTRPRALAIVALLGGLGTAPSVSAAASAASAGSSASAQDQPWLRGRIGLQVQGLTEALREHFSAPADRGLLVARVEPDRPAARAGIRVGDVLVEADGVALRHPQDLLRSVGAVAEGESFELLVIREGESRRVRVEPDFAAAPPTLPPDSWQGWERWLDRGLRQGSRELRSRLEELEQRLEELEGRLDSDHDGPDHDGPDEDAATKTMS